MSIRQGGWLRQEDRVFAELVRVNRRRLGLTQEDLAERTGLSVRAVGKLEGGRVATPRPATIRRLADVFGLTGSDRERFYQAAAGGVGQPAAGPVPAQLPLDVPAFTGRDEELARMDALLAAPSDRPIEIVIVALSGIAGVGKTALAVHWSHRIRDRFPDGQLFANLRGVDGDNALEPFAVLGRFLRALGVGGDALPATLDERVELYRTLLSTRRVLIVLDDAREDQIMPLMPAGSACAVLITSRARLGVTAGMATLELDVLSPPQAVSLLSRLCGHRRVAAEPDAAAALAHLCGHLPLAIRIAGAKLAAKPHWRLDKLLELLRDEQRRLDVLAHSHLDVRASIGLSYRGLTSPAQRLIRRLGDLNLPQVSAWSAAAQLEMAVAEAEAVLDQLFDAQLLEFAGYDAAGHTRYRLHDLVRLFAREAAAHEPEAERMGAQRRVFGCWLELIEAAYRAVFGGDYLTIRSPAPHWFPDDETADRLVAEPLRWLESEEQTVIAIVGCAADWGCVDACWGIACSASPLLAMQNNYDDRARLLETAHAATIQAADVQGQAAVLHRMGMLCADRGEYQQAWGHFQTSAGLFEKIHDRRGWAIATALIAMVERWRGNHDLALTQYEQALAQLREYGDHGGVAYVLRSIGQTHIDRGDYGAAEEYLERAMTAATVSRSLRTGAQVLFWQGMLRSKQERWTDAERLFVDALEHTREVGDRTGQAYALRGLALCYHANGDPARAEATIEDAIRLVSQPCPTHFEARLRQVLAQIRARSRPGDDPDARAGTAQLRASLSARLPSNGSTG